MGVRVAVCDKVGEREAVLLAETGLFVCEGECVTLVLAVCEREGECEPVCDAGTEALCE